MGLTVNLLLAERALDALEQIEARGLVWGLVDNALSDDEVTAGNIRDDVLANAPDAEHGFFAVPKVIE